MNIRTFALINTRGALKPEFTELDATEVGEILIAPSWKSPEPFTIFGFVVTDKTIVGIIRGDSALRNIHVENHPGRDVIQGGHRFVIGSSLNGLVTGNERLNTLIAMALEGERRKRPLTEAEIMELT